MMLLSTPEDRREAPSADEETFVPEYMAITGCRAGQALAVYMLMPPTAAEALEPFAPLIGNMGLHLGLPTAYQETRIFHGSSLEDS